MKDFAFDWDSESDRILDNSAVTPGISEYKIKPNTESGPLFLLKNSTFRMPVHLFTPSDNGGRGFYLQCTSDENCKLCQEGVKVLHVVLVPAIALACKPADFEWVVLRVPQSEKPRSLMPQLMQAIRGKACSVIINRLTRISYRVRTEEISPDNLEAIESMVKEWMAIPEEDRRCMMYQIIQAYSDDEHGFDLNQMKRPRAR